MGPLSAAPTSGSACAPSDGRNGRLTEVSAIRNLPVAVLGLPAASRPLRQSRLGAGMPAVARAGLRDGPGEQREMVDLTCAQLKLKGGRHRLDLPEKTSHVGDLGRNDVSGSGWP